MKIEKTLINTKDEKQEQRKFIRISNCGCNLSGCNCSPGNWLSISDGKVCTTIYFSEKEFQTIKEAFSSERVLLELI
jgi:hypothetical protein